MDQAPKIENELKVEQELSPEEKKTLADAWCHLVLGRGTPPARIDTFSNEQMRAWLYDSLISETLVLRNEWGVSPDMERYRAALEGCTDDTQRGNIQFQFIDFFVSRLSEKMEKHAQGGNRLMRWESWPRAMRESGSFNCVGATLLSIASMEEAGITVFDANPAGHAVAIAQLQDGEYVFVDSNNFQVRTIVPEKREIGGVPCFVIHHSNIEYEIIPVFERGEIVFSILLNLSGVVRNLENDTHESPEQKSRTQQIYKDGAPFFESVNFRDIRRRLYGVRRDPWNSQNAEFQNESMKVGLIHDFSKFLKEKGVDQGIVNEVRGIFAQYPTEVEAFMLDLDAPSVPGASAAAMNLLTEMHKAAWSAVGSAEVIKMACRWLSLRYKAKMQSANPTSS